MGCGGQSGRVRAEGDRERAANMYIASIYSATNTWFRPRHTSPRGRWVIVKYGGVFGDSREGGQAACRDREAPGGVQRTRVHHRYISYPIQGFTQHIKRLANAA